MRAKSADEQVARGHVGDGHRAPGSRRTAGTRLLMLALCGALMAATVGCERHRATSQDCTRIFDRLVEVELLERGLRDPVLLSRRARELERTLAPSLAACTGRPLPSTALDCIAEAPNAEALIHRCLK